MTGAARRPLSGFTLIEMVIAMAILAVLVSIAAPLTQTAVQRNREQDLRAALRTLRDAIDAYKSAADAGWIEKRADQSGYPPDLDALVAGVRDVRSVSGEKMYFLRRIPRDPFDTDPGATPPRWGLRSYESPPDAPRPGRDVFDVYSLSSTTGLNGVPHRDW